MEFKTVLGEIEPCSGKVGEKGSLLGDADRFSAGTVPGEGAACGAHEEQCHRYLSKLARL